MGIAVRAACQDDTLWSKFNKKPGHPSPLLLPTIDPGASV